ncbi:MAG: M43 family zinc metalloprotease [Runella sp.]
MKRLIYLFAFVLSIWSCDQPTQPLEDFYHFRNISRFSMANPLYPEMVIGERLNLESLLTLRDANNQKVNIPEGTLLYYANGQVLPGNIFTATAQGTYRLSAGIGNRTSNSVTITVLPPGVYPNVRIPVIFHAVSTNLTEAQISNLINGLTASFRNQWRLGSDPKDPNSADCFVSFYAADTDPTGRTLTVRGLNRVTGSRTQFTEEQGTEEAWRFFWEPTRYLNVWVMGFTGSYQNVSFAYYPSVTQPLIGLSVGSVGSSPSIPYGVFLNSRHTNLIPLFAHEVGHALGLRHVFAGNLDTFSGCTTTDPDFCADTPYYDRNAYVSNINALQMNRTSCTGIPYVSTNFMDYDRSFENSFTRDQRLRVRHVISHGLWLPTPFNGAPNRRVAANGYVPKPDDYRFVPPIHCGPALGTYYFGRLPKIHKNH